MRFDDAPVDDVSLFIDPVDEDELPFLIEPELPLELPGDVVLEEPVEPLELESVPVEPVEPEVLEPVLLEPVEPVAPVEPELVSPDVLGDVEVEPPFVVAPGVRPVFASCVWLPGVCVDGLPAFEPLLVPLEPPAPPVCAYAMPPMARPTTAASVVNRSCFMSTPIEDVKETNLACQAADESSASVMPVETT